MQSRLKILRGILTLVTALATIPQAQAADGAAERLAQAIRFQTNSHQEASRIDYGEFDRLLEFLRNSYPRVFSELSMETVNDYSLLLQWPGTDPALEPILFTAHTDVVPVEPGTEGDWQHPPFDGVIADGVIYGRGTLDDKVGVLSLLEATERLLAEGFQPQRGIVLAFGHDEEIGGQQGAARLARRMVELGLHFQWMVDEGGWVFTENPLLPDKPLAMINISEKGYLTLTLSVTGVGGHSSNPPVVSTIGRLSSALARIEAKPFPPRLAGPVETMFESLAPHVDQPRRFLFENLWLSGPLLARIMADDRQTIPFVRTTTALTMFNAGIKENVVPQRAEAKINFRLLPGDTPDSVAQRIAGIVDDPQVEISYQQWDNTPPVSDHKGPGFVAISGAVTAVYPDAVVVPSLLIATTDTRHYIELADNLYRFHGVRMSTAQIPSIHGTDEYIAVDSYLKTIEIAERMMRLGAGRDAAAAP